MLPTQHEIDAGLILWEEIVPGGAHWSFPIKRGVALRITDLEGGANVSALFYNQDEKLERYNMADTLKAQHTAHLTKGFVCYSDMGRVLASIVDDSCGWHDTICGMTDEALVKRKYGEARYQEHRNAMHRNARDGFIVELGKWGLGKRDIVANVNFFSKVAADEAGNLNYQAGNSGAGDHVDLRFEMNALVVLAACQHPLDPNPDYAPKPVSSPRGGAEPRMNTTTAAISVLRMRVVFTILNCCSNSGSGEHHGNRGKHI